MRCARARAQRPRALEVMALRDLDDRIPRRLIGDVALDPLVRTGGGGPLGAIDAHHDGAGACQQLHRGMTDA